MSVKDLVLKALAETDNSEGFVSGQELAEKCGVTRTSVWKAVEALRKQGAGIEAVTNRGYRLTGDGIFSEEKIRECLLQSGTENVKIQFFNIIDSTNTEAKRQLALKTAAELHKTVFVAAEQTAGRGRLGRKFFSPSKTGIYLSIVYSPGAITNPALFTATAAVAVCRAISSVFGVEAKIKWVNDIFINGSKVCGILTEGVCNFETGLIESAIIGIGINIANNSELPQDVAGGVISGDENNTKRSELSAGVISELLLILDGGEETIKKSMEEYKNRSFLIGQEINVSPVIGQTKNDYVCKVLDITEEAKLVVELNDGTKKTLDCGEVSIHSKKM